MSKKNNNNSNDHHRSISISDDSISRNLLTMKDIRGYKETEKKMERRSRDCSRERKKRRWWYSVMHIIFSTLFIDEIMTSITDNNNLPRSFTRVFSLYIYIYLMTSQLPNRPKKDMRWQVPIDIQHNLDICALFE